MNYAAMKTCDIANGPGMRVSLFVSGCTRRCNGCFQPQTWDFNYGDAFTQDTIDTLCMALAPPYIAGLSVLGGEPFEPQNQASVLDLLRQVRSAHPNKNIWAFTGYLLDEELLAGRVGDTAIVKELLSHLDVAVDGPFQMEHKNLTLRFRGSTNQRLIDLPRTLASNTVVLWDDGYTRGGINARDSC